jgi:hypothetical protein
LLYNPIFLTISGVADDESDDDNGAPRDADGVSQGDAESAG